MHSSGGENVLLNLLERRTGEGVRGAPQEKVPTSSFAKDGIESEENDLTENEDLWGLAPIKYSSGVSGGLSKTLRNVCEFDRVMGDDFSSKTSLNANSNKLNGESEEVGLKSEPFLVENLGF